MQVHVPEKAASQCTLHSGQIWWHVQEKVRSIKFPDRESQTGRIINQYLAQGLDVDDNAVHLLFSANRWEKRCALSLHANADGHSTILDFLPAVHSAAGRFEVVHG